MAFLWREVNGEFMYGSEQYGPFPVKWREILRVPDTAQAFTPGYYADCFIRLVKAQPYGRGYLHSMLEDVARLQTGPGQLEDLRREDGRVRYVVEAGVFDSNPCRISCFLNPLYEVLPRNDWSALPHTLGLLKASHPTCDPERALATARPFGAQSWSTACARSSRTFSWTR